MLREGDALIYYEDDLVQAMPLDFKNGGAMYIILPKSGDAAGLLKSMTNEYFSEIQSDSILATGKLLLPRFSVEYDIAGLKEALKNLGVPLFDKNAVVLTGGLIEEDTPVWLSDAVQKAVIKVDEKGTTAAAVTVMPAENAADMPEPTEPFQMICDRPFVFILCEHTHDGGRQILFTGVVNQP
jgi:serpin B